MKSKVYKLCSDNYQNVYVTEELYKKIRLSMSTGDFHTHKAVLVKAKDLKGVEVIEYECEACADRGYLEVTHEDGHEYIEYCQACGPFMGPIGFEKGLNEEARSRAVKDGYKLTKTGKIKE